MSNDVITPAATFDKRDTVIVLHGYYGSALREIGGGARRWLTLGTLLTGTFPIALHSHELQVLKSPALEVEGLIRQFSIVPKLYSADVYGEFFSRLELSQSRQVVAFSYDWRQDLFDSVKSLDSLVKNLKNSGVSRISFAAHSMGGLLATYYLAYGAAPPESAELNWLGARLVSSAAFFGTPFGGSMSILRNMQHGTGYPWNRRMLQAGTVASFPSSYFLLPLESGQFVEASGEKVSVELSDIKFWQKYKLGLFRDAPAAVIQSRERFTAAQVARAAQFQKLVGAVKSPPASLKLFNTVGIGRRTLSRGYIDAKRGTILFRPEDLKEENFSFDSLNEDGDGTVPLRAASIPPGLESITQIRVSNFSHDRLFMDPIVEREYSVFLAADHLAN